MSEDLKKGIADRARDLVSLEDALGDTPGAVPDSQHPKSEAPGEAQKIETGDDPPK